MSPIKITYPEKSEDVQGPKQTLNVIKKKDSKRSRGNKLASF